eukprot:Gb_07209 [translate_table: standard]
MAVGLQFCRRYRAIYADNDDDYDGEEDGSGKDLDVTGEGHANPPQFLSRTDTHTPPPGYQARADEGNNISNGAVKEGSHECTSIVRAVQPSSKKDQDMASYPDSNIMMKAKDNSANDIAAMIASCKPAHFQGDQSIPVFESGNERKRSAAGSYPAMDIMSEEIGDEEGSDDCINMMIGEKKRRLSLEQVKALEKNFEVANKLDPEKKMQLAKSLGLQPRQIAVCEVENREQKLQSKNEEPLHHMCNTVKKEQERPSSIGSEVSSVLNTDSPGTIDSPLSPLRHNIDSTGVADVKAVSHEPNQHQLDHCIKPKVEENHAIHCESCCSPFYNNLEEHGVLFWDYWSQGLLYQG